VAATSGAGGVRLLGSGRAGRRVRGVTAEDAAGGSAEWLPFTGEPGELFADGDTLLVGLGRAAESTPETMLVAGAAAGGHRRRCAGRTAHGRRRCRPRLDRRPGQRHPSRPAGPPGTPGGVPDAAREGLVAAQAVRLASLLTSAPANVVTPERAARWAADTAERAGLWFSVLDDAELRDRGFGALTAIGGGSANGPRLVRPRYDGPGDGPAITLAGKGITFDSGGLSLKPPDAMQSMRLDIAGAATVLAVMAVLPRLGVPGTARHQSRVPTLHLPTNCLTPLR
jgi:leucyl aminopeptidase